MVWLLHDEKNWRYVYSFWQSPQMWLINGHTDTAWRHRPRFCIAPRGKKIIKLEKLLDLRWSITIPSLSLQIYLWPCVTLTFDLLTPKAHRFIRFPGTWIIFCQFAPTSVYSFSTYRVHKFGNRRTDELTNRQTHWEFNASACHLAEA